MITGDLDQEAEDRIAEKEEEEEDREIDLEKELN